MKTKDLFDYIHDKILGKDLLNKALQIDQNANGVQIWGNDEVKKVALGVSCNAEFLQKAINWGAEVCIFHHGLSLKDKYIYNSCFNLAQQQRLRLIFQNDLTVAGYHFCLDAHPEIGNNAQIIKALNLKIVDEYFGGWGYVAELSQAKFVQEFAKDCSQIFKHDVFMVLGGPEKIKLVGVCSGGAIPAGIEYKEIFDKKIDLHLTGEIKEGVAAVAKESRFNYFAAGHYATEVFGIKAMAEKMAKKFPKLEVQFIEVWNEL